MENSHKIITRKHASELGLKRYFTGKACKHGHISERYIKDSNRCVMCKSLLHPNLTDIEKSLRSENSIKKRKEYVRKYQIKNKEKIAKMKKKYNLENKEKIKNWRYINRDRINLISAKNRSKYDKTGKGKISNFIRDSLRRITKYSKNNKTINTMESLNYTIEDFKKHIENKFDTFMTWNNHGLWHIDHIEPLSLLVKLHKDKPQKEILNIVNALENLQPLWAIDNLKKGSKTR